MSKKYRSDAMASVHETMEALHKVGAIGKQTMRRFDDACLTQVQALSPKQIKALRLVQGSSFRRKWMVRRFLFREEPILYRRIVLDCFFLSEVGQIGQGFDLVEGPRI